MEGISLQLIERSVLGKKSRFLRRQGATPCHLYGHGIASLALQADTKDIEAIIGRAGTTRLIDLRVNKIREAKKVFIREIQRDPVSDRLIHVDFYQVNLKEKITTEIPVVLIGEAPALKDKNRVLVQPITHLTVEALPEKLPPQVEIDLSAFTELDQALHVKDIHLGKDVVIANDPELLVVKVAEVTVRAEEEAAPVVKEAEVVGEAAVPAEGAAAEEPAAE